MHIWFAPASHSNANASVRGAAITSDGSVRVQDWNGEWTIAENAPKDLTMLAIPGGHLWGLRGDGMLFRWSVQSDRRRWVRDTSIDRVNWICVSPENELCVVNEDKQVFVRLVNDQWTSVDSLPGGGEESSELETQISSTSGNRPRKFRFTLRTMMLAVLVCGLLLGPLSRIQQSRKQDWQALILESNGDGDLQYAHEFNSAGKMIAGAKEPGPAWVKKFTGRHFFLNPIIFKGQCDLEVLANFNTLREVELTDATEIAPLKRLRNVRVLTLHKVVEDLSPLEQMESLEELRLYCPTKRDLQSLSSLTNLRSLTIVGSEKDFPVNDLPSVASLVNLEELTTVDIRLKRCDSLKGLGKLKALSLSRVDNVDGIADLTQLQQLTFTGSILDLQPLSRLTDLRHLSYHRPRLDFSSHACHASAIKNLSKLESLRLNDCQLDTLDWLAQMRGLRSLNLLDTYLNSLDGINNFPQLRELKLGSGCSISTTAYQHLQRCGIKSVDCGRFSKNIGVNSALKKLTRSQPSTIAELRPRYQTDEWLDFEDSSISDISELANAANLKKIYLGPNMLDLSPLASHPKLLTVSASSSEFSDLSPLKNCPALTALLLSGTAVSDLSPLSPANVPQLNCLDLTDTPVSDVSPLKGFNIDDLHLSGTNVTDLSPLSGIKKLRILSAANTGVHDFSALGNCVSLIDLNISNTKVTHLPEINAANLEKLNASHTEIADLAPIGKWSALVLLDLADTKVEDLSPLANCTVLVNINLDNTRVSDLGPLAGKSELRYLHLAGTSVSDLSPLANSNLWSIDLQGTPVKDVTELASLQNLYLLNLSQTNVVDITPLKQEFRELDLSDTQVHDISSLQTKNITKLSVARTPIVDFAYCVSMQELYEVDLSGTKIKQLDPFMNLISLSELKLAGTPVDLRTLKPRFPYKLRLLDVRDCNVRSLDPIVQLFGLKTLKLNCQQLENLQPLKDFKILRTLELQNINEAHQLDWIPGLSTLKTLELSGQVSDIAWVKQCKRLKELKLPKGSPTDDKVWGQAPRLTKVYVDGELVYDAE